MKHLFITTFFSLLVNLSLAQTSCSFASISEGPEQKEGASIIKEVIGFDSQYYFLAKRVSRMGPQVNVSKINLSLVETLDKEVKLKEYEEHERDVDFFAMVKDKIYLFSHFTNKKTDNFILTCDEINKETLELTGEPKKIISTEYKRRRDKGYFYFEKSPDESKFLVYAIYPDDKNPGINFEFKVYDNNMQELRSMKSQLEADGKYMIIKQFLITNSGGVYITACEFPDAMSMLSRRGLTYKYRFYAYQKEQSPKSFVLDLEDKYITEIKLRNNGEENISCTGFYSKKPEAGSAKANLYDARDGAGGVFNLTIDSQGKILSKSLSDFSFEFVTEDAGERKKKRLLEKEEEGDEAELSEFDIREIINNDDGSAFVIAEQYYAQITQGQSNGMNSTQRAMYGGNNSMQSHTVSSYINYRFNDIVVIKLDQSGNIQWNIRVRKKQHDQEEIKSSYSPSRYSLMTHAAAKANIKPDYGQRLTEAAGYSCSYTSRVYNGKLYLFFNDNPNNNLPEADLNKKVLPMGRGREIALTAVEINADGKFKRETLLNQEKRSAIIMPTITKPIKENELFMVGDKGKFFQFFQLKLSN